MYAWTLPKIEFNLDFSSSMVFNLIALHLFIHNLIMHEIELDIFTESLVNSF